MRSLNQVYTREPVAAQREAARASLGVKFSEAGWQQIATEPFFGAKTLNSGEKEEVTAFSAKKYALAQMLALYRTIQKNLIAKREPIPPGQPNHASILP